MMAVVGLLLCCGGCGGCCCWNSNEVALRRETAWTCSMRSRNTDLAEEDVAPLLTGVALLLGFASESWLGFGGASFSLSSSLSSQGRCIARLLAGADLLLGCAAEEEEEEEEEASTCEPNNERAVFKCGAEKGATRGCSCCREAAEDDEAAAAAGAECGADIVRCVGCVVATVAAAAGDAVGSLRL